MSDNETIKRFGPILFRLAVTQIVVGVLAVVFEIVTLSYYDSVNNTGEPIVDFRHHLSTLGAGIWCGGLFICSGIVGIVTGKNPSVNYCTLAMTIISMLLAVTLLSINVVLATAMAPNPQSGSVTLTGLHAMLSIFGVLAFILSLAQLIVCCIITCGFPYISRQSVRMNSVSYSNTRQTAVPLTQPVVYVGQSISGSTDQMDPNGTLTFIGQNNTTTHVISNGKEISVQPV